MATGAVQAAGFRFSYRDVASREGLTLWREVIGRSILKVDLTVLEGLPFHSEATTLGLPGARLAFSTKSGLRMERTRALAADGIDDVALHICTAGTWAMSYRGDEIALAPGQAAVVSDAEFAAVTCPSQARSTCVQLPRAALAPLVTNLDDKVMRPINYDNDALKLLLGYADVLRANAAAIGPDLQRLVTTHIRDLAAVALGARDDGLEAAAGGVRAARLLAIKADICRHLHHHDLSVSAVAARQRLSRRYVQMLLEEAGTTFSAFVLQQRLASVHAKLSELHGADGEISRIAFDAGFNDLSHFNRAFRARYGATPSDVRALMKIMVQDG